MTHIHPRSNQQPNSNPLWQQNFSDALQGIEGYLGRSVSLFRLFGYGLLILAALDLVVMMIPFQGLNPEWELQTFGELVEKAAIPLLAFVCIFSGYDRYRTKRELPVLRLLSWLCLAQAVVFVLLVPLGVINTYRVNAINSDRVVAQIEQQRNQFEQARGQLQQANTVEDLAPFLQATGAGAPVFNEPVSELKGNVSTSLDRAQGQVLARASELRSRQKVDLLKIAIKWCLGALISAALFYYLWQASAWVRV